MFLSDVRNRFVLKKALFLRDDARKTAEVTANLRKTTYNRKKSSTILAILKTIG